MSFCKVFCEALQNTQMANHIVKGFRKCGLCPLNVENVDFTKCVKYILEKQNENQNTTISEQSTDHLTAKDFDSAEKVINKVRTELEKSGINADVVISEINLARELLVTESDEVQYPISTPISILNTSGQFDGKSTQNIVGSIVTMNSVTLLPFDIIEVGENVTLNNFEKSDSQPREQVLEH